MAPRVQLLSHTPDPEGVVTRAARLCYSPLGIPELASGLDGPEARRLLRTILSLGHHSVLEHASFTFGIEGVSRAMTHQLVRHRLASYSQQSQRYVRFNREPEVVLPESVAARPELAEEFRRHAAGSFALYRRLVEAGIPAEDARYLLPSGTESKIIVTMNVRELHHFFRLRCCLRAQWEIRETAERMLELARGKAPALFAGTGPACVAGPCPEGKMTCGKIAEVRERYQAAEKAAGEG